MNYKAEAARQLAEVNKAISNIMNGGQSSSISGGAGSESVTHGNLKDLQRERTRLERIVHGGGMRARGGIGR